MQTSESFSGTNRSPENPDPPEISLFDVLISLKKYSLIIGILTLLATGGAALYARLHPIPSMALVVLNPNEYEIIFDRPGATVYPFLHHLDLGESADFEKRVQAHLEKENLADQQITSDIGATFDLKEVTKKAGPIEITASMRTPEAAVHALEIWISEYLLVVPAYRARWFLLESDREIARYLPERIERDALIAGLTRMLDGAANDDNADRRAAIVARILDLQVDNMSRDLSLAFTKDVAETLTQIAEGGEFTPMMSAPKSMEMDARTCARLQVSAGLNRLFSKVTEVKTKQVVPYRVAAVFMTALIFFSTATVSIDWFRQATRKTGVAS